MCGVCRCLLVLEGVRRCVFNRASVHGDSYGVVKARNAKYIDDRTGETENAEAKLLARKIRATLEGDSQEHVCYTPTNSAFIPGLSGPFMPVPLAVLTGTVSPLVALLVPLHLWAPRAPQSSAALVVVSSATLLLFHACFL